MHRLEHQMLPRPHALHLRLRTRAPGQKHHPATPHTRDRIHDLLREALPALALVRVGRVRAHGQARIQQQHAAVGPGRQQAGVLRWRLKGVGEVAAQAGEDVLEARGRGRRRPHREAEAVRLVDVVVWVLSEDDAFDGGERRVARPGIDVFVGGEDLSARGGFGGEEFL